MKHNQFKSLINHKINSEADTFDFTIVAVDHTNNQRMIYVYTLDYKCVGIFDLWLNNDYVHLSFSQDTEKPIISAKEAEIKCKYVYLDKILDFILKCFEELDKNN